MKHNKIYSKKRLHSVQNLCKLTYNFKNGLIIKMIGNENLFIFNIYGEKIKMYILLQAFGILLQMLV